jgi:hypothetical protein
VLLFLESAFKLNHIKILPYELRGMNAIICLRAIPTAMLKEDVRASRMLW